jgi:hypothetical protein
MKKIIVTTLVMLSLSAFAAQDGLLGITSTGQIGVRVGLPNQVQVTRLDDIDFGTYSGTNDLVGIEEFCVYARGSNPGGVYNINLISQNSSTPGIFHLNNGVDDLEYSVNFDDTELLANPQPMVSGQQITAQQGSNSRSCQGGNNAALEVRIVQGDLDAVSSGTYTDILIVEVSSI